MTRTPVPPAGLGRPDGPMYTRPAPNFDATSIPFAPGLNPPPLSPPVPGLAQGATSGMSQPLISESFMSSMDFNIGRIANPDVTVKNGAIESIRRIGEIHVCGARFFDSHAVHVGAGVTGKAIAQVLKSSNRMSMPRFEAYRIIDGFSNRLRIGAACLSWDGSDREDDRVLSEADFQQRRHAISINSLPLQHGRLRPRRSRHNTLKRGERTPFACRECPPSCTGWGIW